MLNSISSQSKRVLTKDWEANYERKKTISNRNKKNYLI